MSGQVSAMAALHKLVACVAPGTISVLILGETGVGKEVLAETIHRASKRAAAPFLKLNCAALSESLLESELFGHERGSFTGATATKPGLLETANGGTIFLDELGELPPTFQVKLLRVIEERAVLRVGALAPRPIDVRFIAATNRKLSDEIACGRFRQDLYFRLDGITLHVPPLRQRVSEIAGLAAGFIAASWTRLERGQPAPALSSCALARLEGHAWPGNIRELRNVIERAVLLCGGGAILPEHLGLDAQPAPVPASEPSGIRSELADIERRRILDALDRCAGNQTHAARLLGVSRAALVRRLEQYRIPRPRKSSEPA